MVDSTVWHLQFQVFATSNISFQPPQKEETKMSTNFLTLPSELRNIIYSQVLICPRPIECYHHLRGWGFLQAPLTIGLLLANKAISLEAASYLYSQNRFSLVRCSAVEVSSFFSQIGPVNASNILVLEIELPRVHGPFGDNARLDSDSRGIYTAIQTNCTGLVTLTTSPGRPLTWRDSLTHLNTLDL